MELGRRLRDTELELLGRRLRVVACLEQGDVAGAPWQDQRDTDAAIPTELNRGVHPVTPRRTTSGPPSSCRQDRRSDEQHSPAPGHGHQSPTGRKSSSFVCAGEKVQQECQPEPVGLARESATPGQRCQAVQGGPEGLRQQVQVGGAGVWADRFGELVEPRL